MSLKYPTLYCTAQHELIKTKRGADLDIAAEKHKN